MAALLIDYFKPVVLCGLIGAILGLACLGDRKTAHLAHAASVKR